MERPVHRGAIAGVLVLLIACLGCGTPDESAATPAGASDTAASAPKDPCVLLTADDARTALGVDVERTDPPNISGMSMCQYMADNSESVTLQFRAAAPSEFDEYVKRSADLFGASVQPVAGVGERAVMVGDQFLVRNKGRMYVLMLGKNLPAAEKTERTKHLASAVLGRI
ncbi:MAG TPA: hypothetical protein VNJ03_06805 [Vicinamibacterales bacterium]|nr:hypothetical protein [Vicinamibacterales bacterium]